MDKKMIGQRIKDRRLALNMTQGDIAGAVGVAISTIQRYEAGTIERIKLPVIESIARVIGVNADWLIGKTDDESPFFTSLPDNTIDLKNSIADRIMLAYRNSRLTYQELETRTGISKSALQRYITGETGKIPIDRLESIARALNVPAAYLMGWEESSLSDNIIPMPEMKKIPLIGSIACGAPILAEENIEEYVNCPKSIRADFALTCKGDSMINARIFDGDVVYIRQQKTVNNGEIAAVMIEGEATLKRVRLFQDHIVLEPDNPLYKPFVYWNDEMQSVQIIGKAVAFTSTVR